ncbi:nuclear RNA export factor 1-like [Euwallacea similis]|uniref:nuclear RNA export factor 1-like n=1 Tax=Euwallacea similis TaxID=1736056 RepID=UPI00344FF7BA
MPKPNFPKGVNHRHQGQGGGDREFPPTIRSVDYRVDFRGGDRRVSFKPVGNRNGGKYRNKDWTNAIKSHLEEEDIDMNLASGSGKNFRKGGKKNKGGRRGSPAPVDGRQLMQGPTGWYKVSIPYGEKYDKSYLLKLLWDEIVPLPFVPIAWQSVGTTVIFYIDERKSAEKLLSLDRKVQLANGFKLIVKVHPGTPNVDLSPALKEKIKVVMAKRYNAANKSLDLTKLHADSDLQEYFCALFKPIVFIAVLEIIEENIPDLEALCLNDNRLTVFGFLKKVAKRLPHVKILHLANNKIKDMIQLDAFIGLPIVDLLLDGNPLCDRFKNQNTYISEVRKRFPKCMKLDGIELPRPISFDITSEEASIPELQKTYLCDSNGESIVRHFLEQYFVIYDSKNRQPLLEAYHAQAMFSFTMSYPYGLGRDKNVAWLNWYQTESRNVLKVQDADRRCKLLKQGQLSVVSFLQDMPETKHDIYSFTVDLTLYTAQMICLTVSGMFKELKTSHKVPPTRHFFRTLVIVPAGSGFCIANEQYHITNATPDQAKEAFKTPSLPTPASGTAAPPSTPEASPVIHSVASPVALDNAAKQEMVNQIALKTGMNIEWSIKCLEGTDWDFMRACATFDELHSQGSVPPEAFVK